MESALFFTIYIPVRELLLTATLFSDDLTLHFAFPSALCSYRGLADPPSANTLASMSAASDLKIFKGGSS